MNFGSLFDELGGIDLKARGALPGGADSLSEEQARALAGSFQQSATVCAGAGAGKTRLLVERAAALVSAGANPGRVAVVTFTRKAAREISARLLKRVGDARRVPTCATVHSLALTMLKRAGLDIQVASDLQLEDVVESLRDELPSDYEDWSNAELVLEFNRVREEESYVGTLGVCARRFEEVLAASGMTDFTALLAVAAELGESEFDYVLVDEAQDLSALQRRFLRVIGGERAKYWYIGDADQAIYVFRGAHADVMQELTQECDEQFILSMNYRSARSVVQHANNVINFNEGRPAIQWRAHRKEEGCVSVEHFSHGDDELERVRQWLAAAPDRRAVLSRTQAVVASLKTQGLPAFTVHESKGLEWPEVWVVGCEAALFPHPLCGRDEERRLFYVAMTRARDNLVMSYCTSRAQKKGGASVRHPSPFLFEAQALQG